MISYCQRFLLKSSLIIILILLYYFKSLLEELASHYIFDYLNFTKNLFKTYYNSNGFRSSSHYENIFVSNRFEGIKVVSLPAVKAFFNDYYIDLNSYVNRFFLTFSKMSRFIFPLYDIFSSIIDVTVIR